MRESIRIAIYSTVAVLQTLHHVTKLFLKSTITITHTAAVGIYNAGHQQDFSSWSCATKTVKLQVLESKSENNEGTCHCSSAPHHACKSELCTLGMGETAGFVVMFH